MAPSRRGSRRRAAGDLSTTSQRLSTTAALQRGIFPRKGRKAAPAPPPPRVTIHNMEVIFEASREGSTFSSLDEAAWALQPPARPQHAEQARGEGREEGREEGEGEQGGEGRGVGVRLRQALARLVRRVTRGGGRAAKGTAAAAAAEAAEALRAQQPGR
jgi:hypothetical protein